MHCAPHTLGFLYLVMSFSGCLEWPEHPKLGKRHARQGGQPHLAPAGVRGWPGLCMLQGGSSVLRGHPLVPRGAPRGQFLGSG